MFSFACFDNSYKGNIPIPPPIVAILLYFSYLKVPYPNGPIISISFPSCFLANISVPFPFTWNINSNIPFSLSKLYILIGLLKNGSIPSVTLISINFPAFESSTISGSFTLNF